VISQALCSDDFPLTDTRHFFQRHGRKTEIFSIHRRIAVSQRLTATAERSGFRTHIGNGKHFVVRADEKLTTFMELESTTRQRCASGPSEVKLKLVYGKNNNWFLFNPNQLQKFPQ
jgi:hypothetical protein